VTKLQLSPLCTGFQLETPSPLIFRKVFGLRGVGLIVLRKLSGAKIDSNWMGKFWRASQAARMEAPHYHHRVEPMSRIAGSN
jgi:hypothetical protein